jgi:hypothetical protein
MRVNCILIVNNHNATFLLGFVPIRRVVCEKKYFNLKRVMNEDDYNSCRVLTISHMMSCSPGYVQFRFNQMLNIWEDCFLPNSKGSVLNIDLWWGPYWISDQHNKYWWLLLYSLRFNQVFSCHEENYLFIFPYGLILYPEVETILDFIRRIKKRNQKTF